MRARFMLPIVLVVDDVEDNRDLLAMVLGRRGWTVHLAVDGLDAVERARALRPTVILMDLAMPNMDGFEATRAIRATPELAKIPIFAVSAFTDTRTVQRAIAAGCTAVVAKPCSHAELTAQVEEAIRVQLEAKTATPSR